MVNRPSPDNRPEEGRSIIMNYLSTRDTSCRRSASEVILQGISQEGGLFVPEQLPVLSQEELQEDLDYCARAEQILGKFLGDFTAQEIRDCVYGAYTGDRFENDMPAPLSRVGEPGQGGAYMIELWHGPTSAFKDLALQILPRLMAVSAAKRGAREEIVILVATSGDTGKAALEGFADAPGTRVLVFYPQNGVSEMQKLQMRTQEGENVSVCAIEGNFDDAQAGVKRIFTDETMRSLLSENGMRFSSANSINWGRLLPQIVYYVNAYCKLVHDEEIAFGETVNVVVPTGNFGNILAAYYAKRMGVPFGKLICASNRNNVLTDFIRDGVYDRNRAFFPSLSPSMDILVSSNLERLLFELCDRDEAQVRSLMDSLAREGRYTISSGMHQRLRDDFAGFYCDDARTKDVIRDVFERCGYLLDTHTAVAWAAYEDYLAQTGDTAHTLIASTASPYKFADSVCDALGVVPGKELFAPLDALHRKTGAAVPGPIAGLRTKTPRFNDVCTQDTMDQYVRSVLGL